jgi:excinuclease ABC subunit B
MPRFTIYPSSHYVTPRDTRAGGGRDHQAGAGRAGKAVGDGKLVEAQRLEQRTRFDLEMLAEWALQGHRELLAPPVGRRAGRAAATLFDYLPPTR